MPKKKMQITLSDTTIADLEKLAEEKQVSKSVIIALAIAEYKRLEEQRDTNATVATTATKTNK